MIYSSFCLLLTHLWIGFISCAVYHIVPSPNHHCPVESCLTLSSFAANTSLYIDSNTLLIFQPGNHVIRSQLNVTGVVNFSMISDQSRAGITCENDSKSEFVFNGVNHVYVSNLKFYECYCDSYDVFIDPYACYGINLITLTASSLVLVKCTFEDNVGTDAIEAAYSNITIVQSTFNNYVGINSEMLKFLFCNTTIVSSTFIDNGGTLLLLNFVRNTLNDYKMMQLPNTLTITGCEFRNNHQSSEFLFIPIIDVYNSDISSIHDTNFIDNKAYIVLRAEESVVTTHNCTFKYNHGLAMVMTYCKVDIFNSVFYNNKAEGTLYLGESIVQIHGSEFKENVGKHRGAIQCFGETFISFSETCTLADNHAKQGGAIYLRFRARCLIAHGATVIIANNTASKDGGGIYLSPHSNLTLHSQSTLQILENRATNNGGGIFASELSSINLGFESHNSGRTSDSTIYFNGNRARNGGGLYLELNSVVYIFPCLNNIINFDKNSADYGGAVYVLTAAKPFWQDHYSNPECFFQSETLQNPAQNYNNSNGTMKCNKKPFFFSLNRANYLGFALYKEAFNNCSINETLFDEFKLLSILSNIQTSDIGSSWVQVCYCENGLPDCSKQIPYIDIKPGEKIILDVTFVGKANHIVSGSIKSEIRGSVQIHDDQKIQDVINGCTALIFNILYSSEASQQLIMSPQIESDNIHTSSEKSIKINFLACINCPIGFQQVKDDAKGCDCVCDVMKLGSHILTCNYTRETIAKKGTTAWIGYSNVKNTSGYLIYPYCPMDFCFPPDATVEINLNLPNGADAQCAHNRSGLLCGACSPGLSLSLGSSCCLQCHEYWPGVLVVIIICSLLAGFILVVSLLMLNLTVVTGTLSGLIFYVNIVTANQEKFFPSRSVITVFVSWLNLELGIDTCFFDGMDFYWKTWIQLAFPAYILLLVVLVIIVSEHSVRFAEIVAKGNPLATLNTLILLSYVKFLRTIILAFSFATLDYPDHSRPVVWWPDASVGYFSGKHAVIWIAAVIILFAGVFYTAILFSWQWLLYYQHKRIFKWITRNQRLCMFIEPNHAPYAFKHRYWAGLLLLVRVIVYIISTADVSSDRTITLLAIGIIVFFLTILVCSFQPHKNWPVQGLDVICYANIVCFCFATLYVSKVGKNQDVIAYISGTISLVLFLIVLSYHVITQLFFATWLGKNLKNKLAQQFSDTETEEQANLVVQDKNDEPVTYSEVDPPTRGGEELPQSHSNIPRSKRNRSTTNNILESADYEENELKPIEQKMADSSTPYTLMK